MHVKKAGEERRNIETFDLPIRGCQLDAFRRIVRGESLRPVFQYYGVQGRSLWRDHEGQIDQSPGRDGFPCFARNHDLQDRVLRFWIIVPDLGTQLSIDRLDG